MSFSGLSAFSIIALTQQAPSRPSRKVLPRYGPSFLLPERKFALYTPLNPARNEIRVLYLYPAETRSSPIRCSLHQESLDIDPPPEYTALSYTWNDPFPPDSGAW